MKKIPDLKNYLRNINIFLIANIVVPILLGAVFYYLYSSDVLFVKKIDWILGLNIHFDIEYKKHMFLRFVRNYLLDMFWVYSLFFTLFLIIGKNSAKVWKVFFIAFSFSAIMEILQMIPCVSGTFDFYDVVFEFLAEVIAVFVIKLYFVEEKRE